MRKKHDNLIGLLLGVGMGLGGQLFLPIPGLGFVAMLDFAAYCLAIPLLIMNWPRMGKHMHRSILWGLAWMCAAMLSNLLHFQEARYWLKCVVLASSSWTLMTIAYFVLKNHPTRFMWYMAGAGLGGWISLYYFRCGALEVQALAGGATQGTDAFVEKQIYPLVAGGLFYGCVLPIVIMIRKFPLMLVWSAAVFQGFYLLLHGGSRSSFGVSCAGAAIGFAVAYTSALVKRLAKNPVLMIGVLAIGGSVLFGTYKYMASSGKMGEAEAAKLEDEFGEGGRGVVKGRSGFDRAWDDLVDSVGIGLGGHLRNHSTVANSMACDGVVGGLFWVFFYFQCFWFVCHRLPLSRRFATFLFLQVVAAGWNAFGSPFGGRHQYFVLLAFIALCRDDSNYGLGTIFDAPNLWRKA